MNQNNRLKFEREALKRQVLELEGIVKFLVSQHNSGNLEKIDFMAEKKGITYSLAINDGKIIFKP